MIDADFYNAFLDVWNEPGNEQLTIREALELMGYEGDKLTRLVRAIGDELSFEAYYGFTSFGED